jgi:hypothetical protein
MHQDEFSEAGFMKRGTVASKPTMRVFLDDQCDTIRAKWAVGYTHKVKTAQEAIELLKSGSVTHISLDHDLGDPAVVGTGYDVAKWLEEAAYLGTIPKLSWNIHSMNPVGEQNMRAALMSADRYWAH